MEAMSWGYLLLHKNPCHRWKQWALLIGLNDRKTLCWKVQLIKGWMTWATSTLDHDSLLLPSLLLHCTLQQHSGPMPQKDFCSHHVMFTQKDSWKRVPALHEPMEGLMHQLGAVLQISLAGRSGLVTSQTLALGSSEKWQTILVIQKRRECEGLGKVFP